jgi:hypothetical protein
MQVVPQAPQFWSSLVTSVHVVPHNVSPELQAHLPETQWDVPVHAKWQAPQFESSLWTDMHEPPQYIWSCGHGETHRPAEQPYPMSHTRPHAPQFCGSPVRSVHEPSQFVDPCWQTQLPWTQVVDGSQALSHEPQLLSSVCVSTHPPAPAQNVRPDEQEFWHTPRKQPAPAGHTLPQEPQLEGSLCTSPQGESSEPASSFDEEEPLEPPDEKEPHAEPATRIAMANAVVEPSAKRARQLDVGITSVLSEQGGCPSLVRALVLDLWAIRAPVAEAESHGVTAARHRRTTSTVAHLPNGCGATRPRFGRTSSMLARALPLGHRMRHDGMRASRGVGRAGDRGRAPGFAPLRVKLRRSSSPRAPPHALLAKRHPYRIASAAVTSPHDDGGSPQRSPRAGFLESRE